MLVVAAGALLVVAASPAGAHTGFESSTPADGESVSEPVTEITLTFSGPAEPAGDGFVVLDPSGTVRSADSVDSADGQTWVLRFDDPLSGGVVGVRWSVQAPDAHPIEGSFSFTVDAEATGAAPSAGADPAPESDPAAAGGPRGVEDLEGFLGTADGSSTEVGERVATVGRIVGIGGTLLGIGALVFAAFVLRGSAAEVRRVLFWVRRAGAIVVIGASIRLIGRVVIDNGGDWWALTSPSALLDALWTTTGLAIALRFVGGVVLLVGCRMQLDRAERRPDRLAQVRDLVPVGAGGDHAATPPGQTSGGPPPVVWAPGSGAALSLLGAAILLVGYVFDGHTVTEGNRLATALSDLVHVLGAAVWVGGLLMLVSVLGLRHRRGRDLGALHLAARFSVVAAIAVVAVGLSGLVLAVIVLDDVAALWMTPWGRLLMAKVALVAVAAGIGGYNHRVLIPGMEHDGAAGPVAHRFRKAAMVEAGVLCSVVVTTALLVGAAS